MSKLTIKGSGICFRQICLDDDAADVIVDACEIPDEFYEDQDSFGEMNTLCSGFFCDSIVSLDGKKIGTVKSIVNRARKLTNSTKTVRQYSSEAYIKEVIKEAGSTSFVLETYSTSGVQADFEIPGYVLDEKRKVPDQFIFDFANSLEEEVPGVYFFAKWNENRIESGIDCEELNEGFTLFNRGKEIEI